MLYFLGLHIFSLVPGESPVLNTFRIKIHPPLSSSVASFAVIVKEKHLRCAQNSTMALGWSRRAQREKKKDMGPNRRTQVDIKRHGQIGSPQLTRGKERSL